MNQFEAINNLLVNVITRHQGRSAAELKDLAESAAKAFHAGSAIFDELIRQEGEKQKAQSEASADTQHRP